MAPSMATATLDLTYPPYASDFDPENSDFLIVGGGGGEGRSGVGNKITLIDASRKTTVTEVADVDLSRDEDSVTSLAVVSGTDSAATVYAGINSSLAQQKLGANEHLRSFSVGLPRRKRSEAGEEAGGKKKKKKSAGNEKDAAQEPPPKTEALGKSALFKQAASDKPETYQRVLRLSRYGEGKRRLGAVATGLAPAGEIVVFDAGKAEIGDADVLGRVQLQTGEEANDVDFAADGDTGFLVAYCTDYEIYLATVDLSSKKSKSKFSAPRRLHATGQPVGKSKKRPVFRALRFLSPRLLAVLVNRPERKGADILLLDVPEDRELEGTIIWKKGLHKNIKSATGFATAYLPPSRLGQNVQHVFAVAGGTDVAVLTLDHPSSSNRNFRFEDHVLIPDAPAQVTSLAFSHFSAPPDPDKALPQYLKLAATCVANSVTVHTFPLTPYPPTGSSKGTSRYTLRSPGARSESLQMGLSVLAAVVTVAIGAVLLQAFTEIRGGTPELLGAKAWLPQSVYDRVALPYMFADQQQPTVKQPVIVDSMPPLEPGVRRATVVAEDAAEAARVVDAKGVPVALPADKALEALKEQGAAGAAADKPVVLAVGAGGVVGAEMHAEVEHAEQRGRRWDELSKKEKSFWRKKLGEAGAWAAGEGETVLKSVFFGELAGAVAGAVG